MFNTDTIKKGKPYGIARIVCIAVFSVCVYMFTLSILSIAAIYSFIMIRAIMVTYSRYIGHLDRKAFINSAIISLLIICIGYYFAYTTYYYPYFLAAKGYSYFEILFRLPLLLNELDHWIFPGTLFFIFFAFVCGMAMNKQFMKHEEVNDTNKRLIEFKREVGMESVEEKDSIEKQTIAKLTVIGLVVLAVGIFNDYRFAQYVSINRYQQELSELKEINKEAYDTAREVLKGQGTNYYYFSNNYYIRGEENVLHITADLDAEEYTIYCDQESHGTTLDMEWGDWKSNGKKDIYITLDVKAKGEGYAIIYITNDVDDRSIWVFVDNYDYSSKSM